MDTGARLAFWAGWFLLDLELPSLLSHGCGEHPSTSSVPGPAVASRDAEMTLVRSLSSGLSDGMGRQESAVTGQCSSAIMGAGQSEKEAHDPAGGRHERLPPLAHGGF